MSELHNKVGAHRDIKPENIFLKNGVAKLGDYGLVKSQRLITKLITIAGTRDYMAPEVLEGKPYDHRCDIYSTGVVLRELLTGEQPPFTGEAPDEITRKAMAKEPKDRFQTVEEFITALERPASDVVRPEPKLLQPITQNAKPRTQDAQPIFQKLEIQRYPPKPELRGQDEPGVMVRTLRAKLDELSKGNDYQAMLPVAKELARAVRYKFTEHNSRTSDAFDRLADIHLLLGQYQEAEKNYRISLGIDRDLYGEHSRHGLNDYYHLGEVFRQAGNFNKARECYDFAKKIAIKMTTDYAIIANNSAGIYYLLQQYPAALIFLNEALDINEKQSRVSEPVAINLYNMALAYEAMGNKGTAEPLYKQAKETLSKLPPDKLTLSEKDRQQIIS